MLGRFVLLRISFLKVQSVPYRGWGTQGGVCYHWHCLEVLACGDNKKQITFWLGLLLSLSSLQTLRPYFRYGRTACSPWYATKTARLGGSGAGRKVCD